MLGSEEGLLSELYDVDLDNNYFNSEEAILDYIPKIGIL